MSHLQLKWRFLWFLKAHVIFSTYNVISDPKPGLYQIMSTSFNHQLFFQVLVKKKKKCCLNRDHAEWSTSQCSVCIPLSLHTQKLHFQFNFFSPLTWNWKRDGSGSGGLFFHPLHSPGEFIHLKWVFVSWELAHCTCTLLMFPAGLATQPSHRQAQGDVLLLVLAGRTKKKQYGRKSLVEFHVFTNFTHKKIGF